MITIALAKGALLKDSISIFKKAGLDFSEALLVENRSLTIESKCKRRKLYWLETVMFLFM